ncbi:MAG TPA: cytochrome ubiquinol oxidase subunit I [Bacteroidales bacterium]|nr:cytochrome ubiquinol oxidase subunit I [Bacteroidales bacterium]
MIENVDPSLVGWSRAQFALTAAYHWLFVPLVIGLSFILAIMESIFYRNGSEEWKRITKFWMTLFGINFAIAIATGIILEFEFGTNWSNYSWFVGDIFGAPLAIEGILAFFLEATFAAVMFFGWDKVNRRFHLFSTWLVAIGASISAIWILVANAWMQNPVGMLFNPDTARHEMVNFADVVLNRIAIDSFLHATSSGFLLSSMFVLCVSCWFLVRGRELALAKKSILVACVFGLLSSLITAYTGDESARTIARLQPVKFASMEALYEGKSDAGLKAFGILKKSEKKISDLETKEFIVDIEIPGLLSIMTGGSRDTYIPGIKELIYGDAERGIQSVEEKMKKGNTARLMLEKYHYSKKAGDSSALQQVQSEMDEGFMKENFRYFGYSSLAKPEDSVPDVAATFYAFHLMVVLGFYFILLFVIGLILLFQGTLEKNKWFLWICLLSIPLPYIASELGWVVTEMGRQPWIIQDLMSVTSGVSQVKTGTVITTFVMFTVFFTIMLIAEISIMLKAIRKGPKEEEAKI